MGKLRARRCKQGGQAGGGGGGGGEVAKPCLVREHARQKPDVSLDCTTLKTGVRGRGSTLLSALGGVGDEQGGQGEAVGGGAAATRADSADSLASATSTVVGPHL